MQRQLLGEPQSAITTALSLSIGTVKPYTQRVYRKLAIANRSELSLLVLSAGPAHRTA